MFEMTCMLYKYSIIKLENDLTIRFHLSYNCKMHTVFVCLVLEKMGIFSKGLS